MPATPADVLPCLFTDDVGNVSRRASDVTMTNCVPSSTARAASSESLAPRVMTGHSADFVRVDVSSTFTLPALVTMPTSTPSFLASSPTLSGTMPTHLLLTIVGFAGSSYAGMRMLEPSSNASSTVVLTSRSRSANTEPSTCLAFANTSPPAVSPTFVLPDTPGTACVLPPAFSDAADGDATPPPRSTEALCLACFSLDESSPAAFATIPLLVMMSVRRGSVCASRTSTSSLRTSRSTFSSDDRMPSISDILAAMSLLLPSSLILSDRVSLARGIARI